ncbi:MAG: hypothetical protein GX591_12370 [Planctomycetes bacterium]|nr:hypothetical protein [Planctomycetota bacterium]
MTPSPHAAAPGRPAGLEPLEPRLFLSASGADPAVPAPPGGAAAVAVFEPAAAPLGEEPVGDVAWSPTPFEQEMLEWLNDMRMDPAGHLGRMVDSLDPIHSPDPRIHSALTYFGVDGDALLAEWGTLAPADPLIWNGALMQAARGHSQLMIDHDMQSHQLPGEPSLGARALEAGYSYSYLAENIYAYAQTVPFGHAGFAIDWGFGSDGDGMQDPPGHRNNMMNASLREIGIGILQEHDGQTDVGPLVVTQDLGDRWNFDTPYLTGVVYADADGDGFYDAGEGLGGATVAVTGPGGTVQVTTMTAGGYQIAVQPGEYTVQFSLPGYAPAARGAVAALGRTVKADGILTEAAASVVGRHVFYNHSVLDGGTAGPSALDDNAIAAGKQALLPGQPAGPANRIAYARGLNGIMVDIQGLPDGGGLTLATIDDCFDFRIRTAGGASWTAAPAPTALDVRAGDGVGGSHRVTLLWADGAISAAWLEVTVKAVAATGLGAPDVFSFAALAGDADADGAVTLDDFVRLKQGFGTSGGGTASGDFDLGGTVDLDDFVTLKVNFGLALADPASAAAAAADPAAAGTPRAAGAVAETPSRPAGEGPAGVLRHRRARRGRSAALPQSPGGPPVVDLLAWPRSWPLIRA